MPFQSTLLTFLLPALVLSIASPSVPGFRLIWSESFAGAAGATPNTKVWNIAEAIHTNAELQTYSRSSRNVQLSGGQTVHLVPWKSAAGQWTSGRIETADSFTPEDGKVLLIQSSLALGSHPVENRKGLWPAFWTVGDVMRHGTGWPLAGELDIMETINGIPTAYATLHCGAENNGGPCQEPNGLQASTQIPTDGFHTWGLRIDRTNPDWTQQTISWMLDGAVFNTVNGRNIADKAIFATLAHSPIYVMFNVAVG